MARIVLADDGIEFDGQSLERGPLGGVESSIINLVAELARRGHEMHVRNNCREAMDHLGVTWRPISSGEWPDGVDLYIANRGDKLIGLMPDARRSVFWIHNPARYLMKWRYLSKLWRYKPAIIFIGDVHATTYPAWAPGGERVVIPYGLSDDFCTAETATEPPGPRAVFTSNPLRSLDWLLDLWAERIRPQVPDAEFHLFTGAATYGAVGAGKADPMARVLEKAETLAASGVVVRGPVSKAQLIEEFRSARCMLYRGDINETFCLAVGEAQAMGVPTVVQDLGSVVERVVDGETGFVRPTDAGFAEAAVELLRDDTLWRRQHARALELQRSWRWPDAAKAFEALIPFDAPTGAR
jgi:glycosyltransferase involved in cell wall biosynthesis